MRMFATHSQIVAGRLGFCKDDSHCNEAFCFFTSHMVSIAHLSCLLPHFVHSDNYSYHGSN